MSGMGVKAHRRIEARPPWAVWCRRRRSRAARAALVAALAVEHHAEGAALPLLVLSMTPGMLAWDPSRAWR
ncbi:MAG: hypothetical protein U0Y82_04695 [Thermoleophilia bacterium]